MELQHSAAQNKLDKIRLTEGENRLHGVFSELCESRQREAVGLVNDQQLSFTTLFILAPDIRAAGLYDKLDTRGKYAVSFCELVDGGKEELLPSANRKMVQQTLRWMITTGWREDGLCNAYDEAMDKAASLLINTYRDKTLLPMIAEMIFRRYKAGLLIHDLVWDLFRVKDPVVFKIIAGYLRSQERKYVELAAHLLNLTDGEGQINIQEIQNQGSDYQNWLNENMAYLYFTDESYQQTSNPQYAKVDMEAKYLHKSIHPGSRSPLHPYTKQEKTLLKAFQETEEEEKITLAAYSHQLYHQNANAWKQWISQPFDEQLRIAGNGSGGGV